MVEAKKHGFVVDIDGVLLPILETEKPILLPNSVQLLRECRKKGKVILWTYNDRDRITLLMDKVGDEDFALGNWLADCESYSISDLGILKDIMRAAGASPGKETNSSLQGVWGYVVNEFVKIPTIFGPEYRGIVDDDKKIRQATKLYGFNHLDPALPVKGVMREDFRWASLGVQVMLGLVEQVEK